MKAVRFEEYGGSMCWRCARSRIPSPARHGVHGQGTHAIASATLLAELAGLVADGSIELPVSRTFPLDQVRDAYRELAGRHSHGKIVLLP